MYGYNEKAERQALTDAALAFINRLQTCAPDETDPIQLLKSYTAALANKTEACEEFRAFLTAQRKDLLFNTIVWKQRPFDLLAHDIPLDTAEQKEEAFRLLQSWELLSMAFEAAEADGEDWLMVLRKSLDYYENTTLPQRRSLDVFDHQISYTERLARYQGKTLSDVKDIILPTTLCTALLEQNEKNWKDALLWCAMIYRHLKSLGITADTLAHTDYWAVPSGYGLSIYQTENTPQTFQNHVSSMLKGENAPGSMIAHNDVVMARLSPETYTAFANAEKAFAQGKAADEAGYLQILDDGTRCTNEAIASALNIFADRTNTKPFLLSMFHKTRGNVETWKKIAQQRIYTAWKNKIKDFISARTEEKLDLALLASYKNAEPRALHLLVGYLLDQQPEKCWSGTKDELWTALSDAIAGDREGERFEAYRQYLSEADEHLTILTRMEKGFTLRMEEKQVLALTARQQAILDKVLTADGQPVFDAKDHTVLADLYAAAIRALDRKKVDAKISLQLSTALSRRKSLEKNLDTFLLLTLQWKQDDRFSFESGTFPRAFEAEKDTEDFLSFLTEVRQGRVHKAIRLKKQKDADGRISFVGDYSKVTPEKFDEKEEALFRLLLTNEGDPAKTAADYTFDRATLNRLLTKSLPYELPKRFKPVDSLKAKSKEEMLRALLLSVTLFELNCGRKRRQDHSMTFCGCVDFGEEYSFDEDRLEAYKAFLPQLTAQTGTAKYDARKTFDGSKYTVEITKAVKKKG